MKKLDVILVILWMLVIFSFSNDSGNASSNKSDGIASTIVSFISKISSHDYSDSELTHVVDNCIIIVRKSAHFLEYFILGILILNVIKDYKMLTINWNIIALILCFVYACTDEFHQLFIPGRSGNIRDVVIDTFGSLCGILFYKIIYQKLNKKRKKSKVEI